MEILSPMLDHNWERNLGKLADKKPTFTSIVLHHQPWSWGVSRTGSTSNLTSRGRQGAWRFPVACEVTPGPPPHCLPPTRYQSTGSQGPGAQPRKRVKGPGLCSQWWLPYWPLDEIHDNEFARATAQHGDFNEAQGFWGMMDMWLPWCNHSTMSECIRTWHCIL